MRLSARRVFLTSAVLIGAAVASLSSASAAEKYALVVGVNDYLPTELPSLKYAEADAESLAKALENLGFSVVAMTSRAGVAFRPTTADRIVGQAVRRLEDRDASDTVVLALSGHGVQFKGDKEVYFCPAEARLGDRKSLVPMSRLLEAIGGCRAGRKLLLVDACRNELTPESAGKGVEAIELEPAGVFRADPPAGTVAMFSCRAKEKSFEVASLGHSVFTHHVVEYLSGRAPADRYPSQGDVSVSELTAFVRSKTRDYVDRELAERQTPDVITPDGTLAEWPLGTLGGKPRPTGSDLASVDRKPAMPQPAPRSDPAPTPSPASSPAPKPVPQAAPGDVIENSLGMKLVRIEAGEFLMGSEENNDEKPVHRVKITKPFLLGQTEVTQGQFAEVMNQTPWRGESYVKDGPNVAASYVSWDDAVEFCRKLTESERRAGRLTGSRSYRLPTEAEWEYACRAGTKTKWSFGDDERLLSEHAWWGGILGDGNAKTEQYAHEVGLKKPNPWGLRDMHGNVYEWCSDWYDSNYYGKAPAVDPKGPSSAGSFRVIRGGSWDFPPVDCRSAGRFRDAPASRSDSVGFRVVCELE